MYVLPGKNFLARCKGAFSLNPRYCCEVEPENIPDLVEVVRCEKCRWGRELPFPLNTGETIECGGRYHEGNWYCADGVSKDRNGWF